MGKQSIKLKVSRVISSFKSCRLKDPSTLPSNPVPCSFLRLRLRLSPAVTTTNTRLAKPHHFSLKRHVSSALLSARRSFSRPHTYLDSSRTHSSPSSSSSRFRWEKQAKWHVMAKIPDTINFAQNYDSTPPRQKIYNSAASDDNSNLSPPSNIYKRRRALRRRTFPNFRLSTSSDSGLFSDEETETPPSTDVSAMRHRNRRRHGGLNSAAASPARLSEFMRKMMPCRAEDEVVEGKVRESFAVVKRSEDPYEDFRRSMAEMVVEKRLFERGDLEELLRCFLSLNSEHLHGVIVRAFVDIWECLFCRSSLSIRPTE